ncbi:hypothetical protein ACI782_03860 [Geodermatophilus sp. SYSU D00703]
MAAIRTALNYFSSREIAEKRRQVAEEQGRETVDPADRSRGRTA